MANRLIKDAKDLKTKELIYFRGHAKATYMSDGRTVEDAINSAGTGGSADMSNYYTKAQVDAKDSAITNDLNSKADKTEIPSIKGLASESYVQQEIAKIQPDDNESGDDNVSEVEKEYIDDMM